MSDSDSMSYDFSSRWTVDTILPPQEVNPETDTRYRRRWIKMALVMLVIAVIINVSLGAGLHAAISHVEQLNQNKQRAITLPSTAQPPMIEPSIPTRMPSSAWLSGMNKFTLHMDNTDDLNNYSHGLQIIDWKGPKFPEGVGIKLIESRMFEISFVPWNAVQIYSHLTFKAGTDKSTISDFNQTIWRRNEKNKTETLIVDSQIKNCVSLKEDTDVCHTSVVFCAPALSKGDKIYVSTSHNKDLIRNSSLTFLGIYKLR